ncbi:MAG: hypothetical protein HZA03_02710 [Nitrospinae bacterium]|nr:hypothetical protein [Nitrospinota bacterium]
MAGKTVERLQGTDGVRRPVAPAAGFDGGPLEVFHRNGVMTEEFFELYCHTHVTRMIETGRMEPGDEVLIGWDGRDTEGRYTGKAVDGIAKAGGVPAVLGVIPTPGVAIALVCRSAATAFMITASHNPRDQNGIKVFNAPGAVKPLTAEDDLLSAAIEAADYEAVRRAQKKHPPVDLVKWGRRQFADFHMDPRNTWIAAGETLFAETALIVDAAHGALAGLGAMTFSQLGFGQVTEVAGEQNGDINRDSGVAYLEGIRGISAARFAKDAGIARHKLVNKMFEAGRAMAARPGHCKWLMGVVFDGDGDRFFLLWYDFAEDALHILSGDECSAIQAAWLMESAPDGCRGKTFAYTVESDINVARHIASLGLKPEVMAVGDKWILHRANSDPGNFALGAEETGHSIHAGVIPLSACGAEAKVFAGNGLKGAINTLVAAHRLGGGDTAKMAALLKKPFEPGFKQTGYSYYIDKKLFQRGSEVWKGVADIISKAILEGNVNDLAGEPLLIADEPDMLFVKLIKAGEGHTASIFVRNSGTEDKISVNVRGPHALEALLQNTANAALGYLMKKMKNPKHPMAAAERMILEQIFHGEQPKKEFYAGIDFHRLIYEMEIKQKLVKSGAGGLALTLLGRECVD